MRIFLSTPRLYSNTACLTKSQVNMHHKQQGVDCLCFSGQYTLQTYINCYMLSKVGIIQMMSLVKMFCTQLAGQEAAWLSWGEYPVEDREQDEGQYSQEDLWHQGSSSRSLNTTQQVLQYREKYIRCRFPLFPSGPGIMTWFPRGLGIMVKKIGDFFTFLCSFTINKMSFGHVNMIFALSLWN